MLSMIRAQLFRIVKSRAYIVYMILFCLFAFVTPFSIWLNKVWPAFAKIGLFVLPDEMSALQLYGISFATASFITMAASIVMGYFVASDFKSGFMKNLIQARGGRVSYAAAMVVCAVILACVATLVGIVIVEATLRVQGYAVALDTPFLDVLQWFAQVALCTAAYASLIVLVAIATKSETIAVIGGLFISGGAIEQLGGNILEGMPGIFAVLRRFLSSYLTADMEALAEGVICEPLVYAQALGTILVAGMLASLIMRRRSLA